MNTQYYKVMPIDVLPEESGWYAVIEETDDLCPKESWYDAEEKEFTVYYGSENGEGHYISKVQSWLKPITLTLRELLSTEEGKEIVREIFEDARRITPDTPFSSSGFMSYPTADDFIKTNTQL
jgi:hypothetical protein